MFPDLPDDQIPEHIAAYFNNLIALPLEYVRAGDCDTEVKLSWLPVTAQEPLLYTTLFEPTRIVSARRLEDGDCDLSPAQFGGQKGCGVNHFLVET